MTAKKKIVNKKTNGHAKPVEETKLAPLTVVPAVQLDGTPTRPPLLDVPDWIDLRITLGEASEEQAAAVWIALNPDTPVGECPDPRVRSLMKDRDRMRGHKARRCPSPPMAFVKPPSSRHVILAVHVPANMQTNRAGWQSVMKYFCEKEGQLPTAPKKARDEGLTVEALARLDQLLNNLTDKQAQQLRAPFNDHIFHATVVQPVAFDTALYQYPERESCVMWVKDHQNFYWSCGRIEGHALRRVEEPAHDPFAYSRWVRTQAHRSIVDETRSPKTKDGPGTVSSDMIKEAGKVF